MNESDALYVNITIMEHPSTQDTWVYGSVRRGLGKGVELVSLGFQVDNRAQDVDLSVYIRDALVEVIEHLEG